MIVCVVEECNEDDSFSLNGLSIVRFFLIQAF